MSRLNADGHDESQYLPRGVPPVNAFRAQHGNIRWEGESIKDVQWLPERIFDTIEEKKYLDTCNCFLKLLVHAKRTLGVCDLRGALWDKIPGFGHEESDLFLEVMRGIPRPEANILIWLVWDDYNRGNVALARHLIGTIMHGLENTQKIIDTYSERRNNTAST